MKREEKKTKQNQKAKATHLPWWHGGVACWAGEWFLFRELFHIPLLVRADTSLPLIGAQERTGSICCQNQIIFCQQSRREKQRLSLSLSLSPCGHTHTQTHSSLSSGHYGSLRRRRAAVIFIYFFPNSFIALWQFFFFFFSEQMRGGKVQHSWSWCWIRENTSSAAVVPDSFMMEVVVVEEGVCVCVWQSGAVEATEICPASQEENYVLVWAATESPQVNIWHLESN